MSGVRCEDLADLVADRVVDALDVQLGGERGLHAVDDRELGGALLALLEQPLRLVEQTRVLQRHAHARRHGVKQAHVGFTKGVLAFIILEDDRADDAVAADDRDGRDGLAGIGPRETASRAASCPRIRPAAHGSAPPLPGFPPRSALGSYRQPLAVLVFVQIVDDLRS